MLSMHEGLGKNKRDFEPWVENFTRQIVRKSHFRKTTLAKELDKNVCRCLEKKRWQFAVTPQHF